jgi:uncharacterized pyridoxamine 5'-phosphate oxidase family protein
VETKEARGHGLHKHFAIAEATAGIGFQVPSFSIAWVKVALHEDEKLCILTAQHMAVFESIIPRHNVFFVTLSTQYICYLP